MSFDISSGIEDVPVVERMFPHDGAKILLLDADFIAYTVGYCSSKEEYEKFLKDEYDINFKFAHASFLIRDAMFKAKADSVKLFLTDSSRNFRLDIMPDYKAHRVSEKPPFWAEVRVFLQKQYKQNVIMSECNEADDMIAIHMQEMLEEMERDGVPLEPQQYKLWCPYIIGSPDKDLDQIAGWHVNLKTGEHYFATELGELKPQYSEKLGKTGKLTSKLTKLSGTGAKFFWAQLIMGDAADGFKGIPKKGAAYALKVLDKCKTEEECRDAVMEEYVIAFAEAWYEELCVQGRMAWLQRKPKQLWHFDKRNMA